LNARFASPGRRAWFALAAAFYVIVGTVALVAGANTIDFTLSPAGRGIGPQADAGHPKYSSEVQQPPRPVVTVNNPHTASELRR
jgi:hypothetical protein